MNKVVKKAIEMDEFNNDLPNLEIGDEVSLGRVWDGEGENPEDSYSYKLTDTDWINYEFEIVEQTEDKTIVKITDISLI